MQNNGYISPSPAPTPAAPIASGPGPDLGSGPSASSGPDLSPSSSFGSSSGSGDIVILPEPKKSKKPWVVAGVALLGTAIVVVVVVVVVIMAIMPREDARTAFNRYANYIISGMASDAQISGAYNSQEKYYYLDMLDSQDNTLSFFQNSSQYVANLKSSLDDWNTEDLEARQSIINLITTQIEMHEFLSEFYSRQFFNDADIVVSYGEYGEESTVEQINNIYPDSDNYYMQELRGSYISAATAIINNIRLYSAYGCIEDGAMDEICFNSRATSGDIADVQKNNDNYRSFLKTIPYYKNFNYNLIYNIYEINNLIRGLDENV